MSIPVSKTPGAAPGSMPAPITPTLLLVDDSPDQRRLVQHLLQISGRWRILEAEDGEAALEMLSEVSPHVILTDVYMPRLDGLGLVKQVRSQYPQIPVVLMTGRGSEQLAVEALRAGASDYVPKSTLTSVLPGVLDRTLESLQAEVSRVRLHSGMTGRVTRYEIENDPALVSPLVAGFREDLLVLGVCDRMAATRAGIALEEALLNAIYHGNLEVSSELRRNGDEPFQRLSQERREQPPYCWRRVRVSARLNRDHAAFRIADEGPGFDVERLPDPTDPSQIECPSGRGLLLMKMFMDEVCYNAAGNQVTLVKRRGTNNEEG